jgi:hypothetical protein
MATARHTIMLAMLLGGLLPGATVPAQEPVAADPQQRAGYPLEISPWARLSNIGGYVGYYVGGGAAQYRKAEPPAPDDGTWGWDFAGHWPARRVILMWWHGRRYQGGTGAYKTDGPSVVHSLGPADR